MLLNILKQPICKRLGNYLIAKVGAVYMINDDLLKAKNCIEYLRIF